mgnify:CR=1 FL=1
MNMARFRDNSSGDGDYAAIDISPLIDCVFILLIFFIACTVFEIPHGALGMELTPNYHERTRLFGYAHMIGFIGSIIGGIGLGLMITSILAAVGGRR